MKLTLFCDKPVVLPDKIRSGDFFIEVLSIQDKEVTVEINDNLSVNEHLKALTESTGVRFRRDRPITLAAGMPIWDTIFTKPPPVLHMDEWLLSVEPDKYVYIPNNLLKEGIDTESFILNAMFTEVMVNGYKYMCSVVGDPEIELQCGMRYKISELDPCHGSQPNRVGEKAARLAGSKLVNFDDRRYAKLFLEAISRLPRSKYDSESIKVRVLHKVELILYGKSQHICNTTFMKRFLDHHTPGEAELQTLRGMQEEDFILANSRGEFEIRMLKSGNRSILESALSAYDRSIRG